MGFGLPALNPPPPGETSTLGGHLDINMAGLDSGRPGAWSPIRGSQDYTDDPRYRIDVVVHDP